MPAAPLALRLMADDLTGALDSAAAFATPDHPIRVVWDEAAIPVDAPFAFDTGTRESSAEVAASRVAALAPIWGQNRKRLDVFKVDSLLRGHAGRELSHLIARLRPERVIIAPAIPALGRITRNGRQHVPQDGAWMPVGEALADTLQQQGYPVALRSDRQSVPRGITLHDAETDDDLGAIVASADADAPGTLWVGAAGLASALARATGSVGATDLCTTAPLLGLIGTDHPVMRGQLARCLPYHVALDAAPDANARAIASALAERGIALATCDFASATDRKAARATIRQRFAGVASTLHSHPSLFVSGGETLRAFAEDSGAIALDVLGLWQPGVPLSRLVGGGWSGTLLLSKSGAFGAPDLLSTLIARLSAPEDTSS